ncbi:MAG: hypothetical protein QOJ72_964 [Nocardioidaceae bacterium]|nr:hypothetical protein [Nocardioidaceae bacterium]
MKRTLAAVVAVLSLTAACGGGSDDKTADPPASTTTPTATPTTATPTTTATPAVPATAAQLVVSPGTISAAKVGMTQSQAAATKLFDADVATGDDGCQAVVPLRWKKAYGTVVDVATDESKTIRSMGILGAGPKTPEGIGIGSTLAQVRSAYASLTPITDAGYGQSGAYVSSGTRWLGFLFNEKPKAATDSSKVTFMEVTEGEKPGLMRDGC